MMTKKFISPGGWFSMEYPEDFFEFEDEEGSFLFYNPNRWTGNLRVSASKDASPHYAENVKGEELRQYAGAKKKLMGRWEVVATSETFSEEGKEYVCQTVVTGWQQTVVEMSFTAPKGSSSLVLEQAVASLEIRDERKRYPKEYIPVRVWEVHQIDEAYDWVVRALKKHYKKDFTGTYQDIPLLQRCIDDGLFEDGQRETWEAIGLTFGVILTNEMDGMEWMTCIRGNKEYPSLHFSGTPYYMDPMLLVWEKKHQGEPCPLEYEFNR
ncbi:MAG: DUF3805 domain-containing protein, partial [Bacteroidaceae bacterium]|nr:DUF3805 domain-containing protein [Bacteroidaceae bacterium]